MIQSFDESTTVYCGPGCKYETVQAAVDAAALQATSTTPWQVIDYTNDSYEPAQYVSVIRAAESSYLGQVNDLLTGLFGISVSIAGLSVTDSASVVHNLDVDKATIHIGDATAEIRFASLGTLTIAAVAESATKDRLSIAWLPIDAACTSATIDLRIQGKRLLLTQRDYPDYHYALTTALGLTNDANANMVLRTDTGVGAEMLIGATDMRVLDAQTVRLRRTIDLSSTRTLIDIRVWKAYYTDWLGASAWVNHAVPDDRLCGWSSWYAYEQVINSQKLVDTAAFIKDNLADHGWDFAQMDDGYIDATSVDWLDWDETKIPDRAAMIALMKEDCANVGIWCVPFAVTTASPLVASHPEWFLKLKSAPTLPAASPFMGQAGNGSGYVLDLTHPDVIPYIASVIQSIVALGFNYVKIDATYHVLSIYGATAAASTYLFHDASKLQQSNLILRAYLAAIREALGDDNYLCVSWHAVVPYVAGYADIVRYTPDTKPVLKGSGAQESGFVDVLKSTGTYLKYNGLTVLTDPDAYYVSNGNIAVDLAQTWASFVSLAGMHSQSGDILIDANGDQVIEADRLAILKAISPTQPARPTMGFHTYRHARVLSCRVRGDIEEWTVVQVLNSLQKDVRETLVFADIGLDANANYHVYDYWAGKYYGIHSGFITLDLVTTESRLLALRQVHAGEPQVVSTSQHILQGIETRAWYDPATKTMQGDTELIAGETCTVHIAVPGSGASFTALQAGCSADTGVTATLSGTAPLYSLALDAAVGGTYHWQVQFTAATASAVAPSAPTNLAVTPYTDDARTKYHLTWTAPSQPVEYYNIKVGGTTVATAYNNSYDGLLPTYGVSQVYTVTAVGYNAQESVASASVTIDQVAAPADGCWVTSLTPLHKYMAYDDGTNNTAHTIGGAGQCALTFYNPGYTKFSATLGFKAGAYANTTIRFKIYGDSVLLHDSDVLTMGGAVSSDVITNLDITGKQLIEIVTNVNRTAAGADYMTGNDWLITNPIFNS